MKTLRAFQASHPWLTIAPPRPKTQRNNISVRKDLQIPKELFEYVEPHQEIKMETVETKTSTVSLLELATEFKLLNGLDLGSLYTGEFGKPGKGYIGTFEVTTNNPIGHYQGYIAKKDSGEHWTEIAECDIFILPKN